MLPDEPLSAEEAAKKEEMDHRVERIQQLIDEKGLARFLAEMRVTSHSGNIIVL